MRHGLLHTAANTLGHLGAELTTTDTRLEAERQCLTREWHRLEVAINLGRLQCERAHADAEGSLAAVREARDHALAESQVWHPDRGPTHASPRIRPGARQRHDTAIPGTKWLY